MTKKIGLDRDENGQFSAGNSGGPGRPPRAIERHYLAELAAACPPTKWKEICERGVLDALAGDGAARAWLSKYLIGDPSRAAPTLINVHVGTANDQPELALQRDKTMPVEVRSAITNHFVSEMLSARK